MSHILGSYASRLIRAMGGNWQVYMNPVLAASKGMTVVTSGTQIDSTTFVEGDTITNCYTNIGLVNSSRRIVIGNLELSGYFLPDNHVLVCDDFAEIVCNANISMDLGTGASIYGAKITGPGQVRMVGISGGSTYCRYFDCLVNVVCTTTNLSFRGHYGIKSVFTKNIVGPLILENSSVFSAKGFSNLAGSSFSFVPSTLDEKLVFTDFDNGDFTLNPNPGYSSPISVAYGYKTQNSAIATYNSGENPFIRPNGTVIGALGIAPFQIDFSIGGTVKVSPSTTADSVETLGSNLTRNSNGVEITAASGAVTTNNKLETPAIYIRSEQNYTALLRKIFSNNMENSINGLVSSELRTGLTESECRASTYTDFNINSDNLEIVTGGNFKSYYLQIRLTFTRYS